MDDDVIHVEDPPNPDLDDLQQRQPVIPAVAVEVQGAVRVHRLPSRNSTVTTETLTDGVVTHVLGADLGRARATLVCASSWFYMRAKTGVQAPIPAGVPIVIEHADAVYATITGSAAVLTTIAEMWAL